MFATTKVKIDKALYRRLTEIATIGGYSSTGEFITHILEKEVARFEEAEEEGEVARQLRGLGYIE
jgi:metal-responsive CopG/Arc/MetJ family transcriptional regulator